MARLDIRTIRAMSDDELADAILDKREELFHLRFQKAASQLENTNLIKFAKRDLARLMTVQRERQLAAELAGEDGQNGE
ncbi:MAG: 50S ribosomal protein L29 [Phototrophicales bacterium]|nr:MAG: 50S ribosomal protein L29 [Phototrophicales bacterium]RMG70130.1 MAG: 50S ribosomal protein L29 [Chloroflexota bacterium]